MCFIEFSNPKNMKRTLNNDNRVLMCGYQCGTLCFFSSEGKLLLETFLHNTALKQIKVKCNPNPKPMTTINEDITLLYEGNVIILIDGVHIDSLIRNIILKSSKGEKIISNYSNINFKKWCLSDQSVVNDIISTPFVSYSVCDIHRVSKESDIVHFLSVGEKPPVSFFAPTGEETDTLSNVAVNIGKIFLFLIFYLFIFNF